MKEVIFDIIEEDEGHEKKLRSVLYIEHNVKFRNDARKSHVVTNTWTSKGAGWSCRRINTC